MDEDEDTGIRLRKLERGVEVIAALLTVTVATGISIINYYGLTQYWELSPVVGFVGAVISFAVFAFWIKRALGEYL